MPKSFLFLILFCSGLATPLYAQDTLPEVLDHKESETAAAPLDFEEYDSWLDTQFSLLSHKGTFISPFSYNFKPDESLYTQSKAITGNTATFYEKPEAELQVSFMIPAYRKIFGDDWDLMFAYTHHAWWQLYNAAWSKPFRETNYTPELFVRRLDRNPWRQFNIDLLAYDFGYVHQSNGQIQILSRSWDRVFTRGYFRVSKRFFVILSAWIRLPEDSEQDDNTDILKYMGWGDMEMYYRDGKNSYHLRAPFSARPGVEIKYSRTWTNNLRWYASYRTGYGHSLIEYDREIQRFSIGIALDSFLDKEEK